MKDLNKEYKNMIEADVPDLWDRIEASLPDNAETKPPKTVRRKFYYMSGIAAACICAAIIIPLVSMQHRAVKNGDAAVAEAYTETAAAMEEKAEDAVSAAGMSFDEGTTDAAMEYKAEEAAPAVAPPEEAAPAEATAEEEILPAAAAADAAEVPAYETENKELDSNTSEAEEKAARLTPEEIERAEATAEKVRSAAARIFRFLTEN